MTLMSAVLPQRTTAVGKTKVQTEIAIALLQKGTYVFTKLITARERGSITDN
jgi:hypothetical protein